MGTPNLPDPSTSQPGCTSQPDSDRVEAITELKTMITVVRRRLGLALEPLSRAVLVGRNASTFVARSSAAVADSALLRRLAPGSSSYLRAGLVRSPRGFAASPASGQAAAEETHAFQAETRRLLDIVTNSLYTDKEVFVRELVSNASDALEKCRHDFMAKGEDPGELAVAIKVDSDKGTFVIEDNGLGMSKDDLASNLGTIARSGSKAFVDEIAGDAKDDKTAATSTAAANIIGKFGVGFYSAFMVSDKVDVYSCAGDGSAHRWSSAGDGSYTIAPCEVGDGDGQAPARGTRIVLHVKEQDKTLAAAEWAVESVLKKYSAFVGFPVTLNGKRTNSIDALWTKSAGEVSDEDAAAFYRFVGGAIDTPAFRLHFSADAPLTIRSLLFAPSDNPERGFAGRQLEGDQSGLSLYSRRVLIQQNARGLLPQFMRWVRGVVDCEDVPLNISRESLQDSDLIRRLGDIITKRMLKFLGERAKKEPEKYVKWYGKMGVFLKEGICGDQSYMYKDALTPLLRFETSSEAVKSDGDDKPRHAQISLDQYVERMPEGQKDIYYLVAPGGRKQAEISPYLEHLKRKGHEVLYLYAHVDEFVMQHIRSHKGKKLVSVEMAEFDEDSKDAKKDDDTTDDGESLGGEAMEKLCQWFAEEALPGRVTGVKASSRLVGSPALLTGHEPEAMRRYRMMLSMMSDDATAKKLDDLQMSAGLELNPKHAIVKGIQAALESGDEERKAVAKMVAEQVFDNARIAAGALDDPREIIGRLNTLLEKVVVK